MHVVPMNKSLAQENAQQQVSVPNYNNGMMMNSSNIPNYMNNNNNGMMMVQEEEPFNPNYVPQEEQMVNQIVLASPVQQQPFVYQQQQLVETQVIGQGAVGAIASGPTIGMELQGVSSQFVCKNLTPEMVNDELVKNIFFATGGNTMISIVSFIINKLILVGFGEAVMVNYVIRRQVKNMRIGNRMLNYKSRGNMKLAMYSVVNWMLILFTLGLFYILGYSHEFFYAQLDARIYWGKPAKVSKKRNQYLKEAVCWEPIGTGMGEFKIFSVYLGVGHELLYIFLYISNIFLLGLLSPVIYRFYFSKYFEKVELGRGRFAVIHPKMISSINKHATKRSKLKKHKIEQPTEIYPCEYPVLGFSPHSSHETYKLQLKFVPDLGQLVRFFVTVRLLTVLSCGLFVKCCLESYARNFMNRNVSVDLELSDMRMETESPQSPNILQTTSTIVISQV